MPIDYTSLIGKTRLYIPDTDETSLYFTDDQIQVFLDTSGDDPRLAAASALSTVARDRALTVAWVRDHDLQIDGPKMAEELREQAEYLRNEVANDRIQSNAGSFSIATTPYSFREDSWASVEG